MVGMTRWSPFGSPFQLHREIDDLLGRFLGSATWPVSHPKGEGDSPPPTWWPAVESFVHDGTIGVRVALPGVDPKDVEVSVADDVLTVKGERRESGERKDGGYHLRELAYGAFERHLALPEGVDPGQVTAKYVHGVLEITIPAPTAVAPRRVEIQVDGRAAEPKAVRAA
jgi:HSP20 family protein